MICSYITFMFLYVVSDLEKNSMLIANSKNKQSVPTYFDFPKNDSKSSMLFIPFDELLLLLLELMVLDACGEVCKPAELLFGAT